VEKLVSIRGEAACKVQLDMLRLTIYDTADIILKSGKDAINSFAEGDEQRMMQMGLRRFTKVDGVNAKELRRSVAAHLIESNKYCF
jgi:gamma-glutamyl phosphate reductase